MGKVYEQRLKATPVPKLSPALERELKYFARLYRECKKDEKDTLDLLAKLAAEREQDKEGE